MAKLEVITMKEISAVFQVTDRLGISREAVEIPLSPAHPGSVNLLHNGKYEIVVDSDVPLEQWISTMEEMIKQLMG
ncbi:MAG: hypothetical protein L0Y56_15765 [Nitrospira sp.]|nr:hypothetical protein [Nitrospira sp.]